MLRYITLKLSKNAILSASKDMLK